MPDDNFKNFLALVRNMPGLYAGIFYEVALPHIQRVIVIDSQTGIRIGASELFRLTWEDVDLGQKLIRVRCAHKNPKAPWREIPIRESLFELFIKWRAEDYRHNIRHIIHYKGKPLGSIKRAWFQTLKKDRH